MKYKKIINKKNQEDFDFDFDLSFLISNQPFLLYNKNYYLLKKQNYNNYKENLNYVSFLNRDYEIDKVGSIGLLFDSENIKLIFDKLYDKFNQKIESTKNEIIINSKKIVNKEIIDFNNLDLISRIQILSNAQLTNNKYILNCVKNNSQINDKNINLQNKNEQKTLENLENVTQTIVKKYNKNYLLELIKNNFEDNYLIIQESTFKFDNQFEFNNNPIININNSKKSSKSKGNVKKIIKNIKEKTNQEIINLENQINKEIDLEISKIKEKEITNRNNSHIENITYSNNEKNNRLFQNISQQKFEADTKKSHGSLSHYINIIKNQDNCLDTKIDNLTFRFENRNIKEQNIEIIYDIDKFITKINSNYYAFPCDEYNKNKKISLCVNANIANNKIYFSIPKIGNKDLDHMFVYSQGTICFSGELRWQDISLYDGYELKTDAQNKISKDLAFLFLETENLLINGYTSNNITPVHDISHYKPIAKSKNDAIIFANNNNISLDRIFD
jgi:hypothetical protein